MSDELRDELKKLVEILKQPTGYMGRAAVREAIESLLARTAQPVTQTDHESYFHIEAAARRGLMKWQEQPHNAKWWKKIDGTPIPNDLVVCIAEEIVSWLSSFRAEQSAQTATADQIIADCLTKLDAEYVDCVRPERVMRAYDQIVALKGRYRLETATADQIVLACAAKICQGCEQNLPISEGSRAHAGGAYCYAWAIRENLGRYRVAPGLTRCGEPAGHLIAGASWFACVLPKGHAGEHRRGGNCFKHGEYVGDQCPKWPACIPIALTSDVRVAPDVRELEARHKEALWWLEQIIKEEFLNLPALYEAHMRDCQCAYHKRLREIEAALAASTKLVAPDVDREKRLEDALRKLSNEVSGNLTAGGSELRQVIGNTNANVLELRVVEARAVLAAAQAKGDNPTTGS